MPPKQPMGPSSVAHLASKLLLSDALSAVFRHNYLSSPLSINIINPPVPPGMTRNSPLFQEIVQKPFSQWSFPYQTPRVPELPMQSIMCTWTHTHTHESAYTHDIIHTHTPLHNTHTHIHESSYIVLHNIIHTHTHTHVCKCIHTHTHTTLHTHSHTTTHTHTHTHTHSHTHTL